ncbi:alpha/beta hydrolase [Candidatus Bipolaricaulota bacterium]|nr:alpha/beta hydrolase [Candidatus Bipolaricaulota bacterium]
MKRLLGLSMIGCCVFFFLASCSHSNAQSADIVAVDKYIDVGTHKLRVVLSDIASEYTIVLEAGGGDYSASYQQIQNALAKETRMRVMSYDRSGFGQSEFGPDDLDAAGEVDALKTCLESQGFRDQFILVGHSYGGFLVQLFALRYPELVSGLVLIDPMNVKFVDRFDLDNLNAVTPYFENPTGNFEKAVNRVVDSFPEALEAMRGNELPSQMPVLLITSGHPPYSYVWRECHEEMVLGSEEHTLLVAEGNSHNVVSENPELVLDSIIELINRINSE